MPSTVIVLEPELEDLFQQYQAAGNDDEKRANVLLGDPVYARRVRMPKWNIPVTMLMEPKVAIRFNTSWGISTSKDANAQRADYFERFAEQLHTEWDDVVNQAVALYGQVPSPAGRPKIGKGFPLGTLVSGVYRSHFPDDVKERLRFLAHGETMVKDAARLHHSLSKTRSPLFR